MSAHTPGPWTIIAREVMEDGSVFPRHLLGGERGELICFLEGQVVADIAVEQPGTHWDKTPKKEANARLIAAAPELLEALVLITDNVEQAFPGLSGLGPITQARAAIAKAKGEQP